MGTSSFSTFGELLKYLRRRAQLSQRELAIAVGYTEGHVSRLEKNQRLPDVATVAALFVPALGLENEPETAAHLMRLAARSHGDESYRAESLSVSRVKERTEIGESAESIPSNLPIQLTSFIGRRAEITEICTLLSRGHPARLVTLTGPGGIGKTRLALQTAVELAHLYPDGLWFIDLAPLSTPELISQTIASSLGVTEARSQSVEENLISYLRSKRVLIVIDNCEHLIEAAAHVAEKILRSCVSVGLLATSREPLHIPGEVNFRVPPLSLPREEDGMSQASMGHESMQLFIERARGIQPSFALTDSNTPVIARICRQLDGMPLAIELAAARLTVLDVGQIAARLDDRFHLLTSGSRTALPRHQTLRAVIDWSYDLLSEPEKVLLRRLSIFAGGWTVEAAEAITTDESLVRKENILDLLSQLINKSLITMEWQVRAEARYNMLQTIHEFARKKLQEAGSMEQMRARHFHYFFSMAQEARLFGQKKGQWLDQLEAEHDNLRSALAWSLEANLPEQGAALILPIVDFYWYRGFADEAREWLYRFLETHTEPSSLQALLLQKAGWLTRIKGDHEKASELLRSALEMALNIGGKNRAAWALMDLGLSLREQGDHEKEFDSLSRALTYAQESGENRAIGSCQYFLAESHESIGNLPLARKFWEQGLIVFRAEGDPTFIAWGLEGLAGTAYLAQDYADALNFHLDSLQCKVEVMDKLGIAYSFEGLAQLSAAMEFYERAVILWSAARHLRETMNVPLETSRESIYTSLLPLTRSQLGEDSFQRAWKRGREMKLQDSIEFALMAADE